MIRAEADEILASLRSRSGQLLVSDLMCLYIYIFNDFQQYGQKKSAIIFSKR